MLRMTISAAVQEFLAEGEETAAERRMRLAREAEERERRRLAGEEELMKQVLWKLPYICTLLNV